MNKLEKDEVALNLEQDLSEIATLIWGYIDKKYIGVIKNKIEGYRSESEANMCKEAQLLQALMPFLPEEKQVLERLIEVMVYNDVIERSLKEHEELTMLYRDENKERQQIKKLVYKLIMYKLIRTIESVNQTGS